MNIIEMIERIKSYLDIVSSPRHDYVSYETNIYTAINQIVNDRFDAVKKNRQQKGYAFESIQRLRDELYTLVIDSYAIVPVGGIIRSINYPTDLRFIIGVKFIINGDRYIANPISYNQEKELETDPYLRPRLNEPYRVYYIESANGLKAKFGSSGAFTNSEIDYLKDPAKVSVGIRWDSTHNFVVGNVVIAVEPTVYNSVAYDPGEYITIVAGFLAITSGLVCIGYVNCDLPTVLHEEICKIASGLFEKTVEDYNKGSILENEAQK